MGFLKVIVKPLWEIMNKYLWNELKKAIENLDNSIEEWNKLYI